MEEGILIVIPGRVDAGVGYNEAFQFYDISYASTIGVAGFVLSIIAALLFVFLEQQARSAEER